MARTDSVGQLEVQYRWELLIAGIKRYATDYARTALAASPVVRAQSEESAGAPKDDALRLFLGAAYPVCTSIDPRGYSWSEAYLDQARAAALAQYATGGLLPDEKYLVGAGLPVVGAQQAHAGADETDAARYRGLRARMRFSGGKDTPTTMSLGTPLPAPEHDHHKDWYMERFDASVDRTVDAAIRAAQEGGAHEDR